MHDEFRQKVKVFNVVLEYYPLKSLLCSKCCRPLDEFNVEIRAIKDISRGEEITKCYIPQVPAFKTLGVNSRERMKTIKEKYSFDCKCEVCTGNVPDQEDIMRELGELYCSILDIEDHYKKKPADWRKEAVTFDKIVELTKKQYIGPVESEKFNSAVSLANAAQMARDEDLLRKASGILKQVAEDSKLEHFKMQYEGGMEDYAMWKAQLKSKKLPKKEEIDFFK